MEAEGMKKGVEEMYDQMSRWWEDHFGSHMHQGFFEPGSLSVSADLHAAKIRMIDEALRFAGISDESSKRPKRIVDVGCGIGGTTIYLAKKYGAQIHGITLSSGQVQRAQEIAIAEGLGDQVSFLLADAMDQPFPDGQFDLVLCIDSAVHMADKKKLMSELTRVATPGATIIITTACLRPLLSEESSLQLDEIHLLNTISNGAHLASWCPASVYVDQAKSLSLEDVKMGDWTENVLPHWPCVIQRTMSEKALTSLMQSGPVTIKLVESFPAWMEALFVGLTRYAIITCHKPK